MSASPPKILVGIDIGFTGTGVCYAQVPEPDSGPGVQQIMPGDPRLKIITKWPGNTDRVEYKCPTVVAYRFSFGKTEKKFGFEYTRMKEDDKEAWVAYRFFKLLLDKRILNKLARDPDSPERHRFPEFPKHEDVQNWYFEYLSFLYKWILRTLADDPDIRAVYREQHAQQDNFGRSGPKDYLSGQEIIFILSVPTTWDDETVRTFKELASAAKFGTRERDTMEIGRNEAEAAAIYTLTEKDTLYNVGNNLIMCDAGGGTTDATSLKIMKNFEGGVCNLRQLHYPYQPQPVGSIQIDDEAHKIIADRLQQAFPEMSARTKKRVLATAMDTFQGVKHGVGKPITDDLPLITFDAGQDRHGGVRNTTMETRKLHEIFDSKISVIKGLVERQINIVETSPYEFSDDVNARDNERKVILSLTGGLGSSPYVKKKLCEHLTGKYITVVQPKYAQLAVCKGVVIDRLLQIANNNVPIIETRARASYGIIVREKISKWDQLTRRAELSARKTEKCEVTGSTYLTDSIVWLIKQNELRETNEHSLKRIFAGTSGQWQETLVRHERPGAGPPAFYSDNHEGLSIHQRMPVNVRPEIEDVERGAARRSANGVRGLMLGRKKTEVKYTMRLRISGADLLFELLFNGKVLQKSAVLDAREAGTSMDLESNGDVGSRYEYSD